MIHNPSNKIEHIYIISEDSGIIIKPYLIKDEDIKTKIKIELGVDTIFSYDELKIINGVGYLTLETLNIIERNNKITSENPNILTLKKLNKEKLTTIFKCLGFNIIYCPLIAESIFTNLNAFINIKYKSYEETDKSAYIKSTVIIKQNIFYALAKEVIKALTGTKCRIRKYFNLSYLLISKSIPVVILLGGTSGTGKSTVSSLLASRLGISTVLSTDTIRHIMRNFLSKEEVPVLFASTYEAWKYLKSDPIEEDLSQISQSKRVLRGYCEQSKIVGSKLVKVIENILRRRESVIIEGVHLTVENIKSIMKIHKYTFPFLVYIEKADKHKERFAVRSKLMTLDPRYNKYVENFEHIRTIQLYLANKADRFLLPKIDNSNIDKSIGMIQETILRSFKDIYSNNIFNYDLENDNLANYFNNFSKLSKTLLSSKEANILISQKVNKNFLFEKFFSNYKEDLNENELGKKNMTSCNKVGNGITQEINKDIQVAGEKITHIVCDIRNLKLVNITNIKKECRSDDEVVSYCKNSLALETKIKNIENRNRVNYQMENSKRNKSGKKIVTELSTRTHRPIRDKLEFEDKDSAVSGSFQKLGSIDSEFVNERIKVINETEDEVDSYDADRDLTRSNISCGSISEIEEKSENN